MRFKVDENLPAEVSKLLCAAGHDAISVFDQSLTGEPDERIADVCKSEQRAIISLDLDFADIRTYPPADYSGLIVLRSHAQDKRSVLAIIERLLPLFESETLVQRLWVVDESALRIRGET